MSQEYETATTWADTVRDVPSSSIYPSDLVDRSPLPPEDQEEPKPPPGPGWQPFAGGVYRDVLFTRWMRPKRETL